MAIAAPLAVAKFELTFAEWDACYAVGGCPKAADSGMGRGSNPVINVSWIDAGQYVAWLSLMTGKSYRLLSEAEYEYASRGGTHTAYYWGDQIGANNANCADCRSAWDNKRIAPVGKFAPNPFGLYDMSGNIWEWVADCYHENYIGAPADGSAWMTGNCGRHMIGVVAGRRRNIRCARNSVTTGRRSTAGTTAVSGLRERWMRAEPNASCDPPPRPWVLCSKVLTGKRLSPV